MGRQWPGLLIGVFLGAIFGAFGGYVRGATGAQEAVGRRLWSESRRLPRLARPSMDGSGGKYVFSPPARLHGQPIVFWYRPDGAWHVRVPKGTKIERSAH